MPSISNDTCAMTLVQRKEKLVQNCQINFNMVLISLFCTASDRLPSCCIIQQLFQLTVKY